MQPSPPLLYTLVDAWLGWTLERTADFPKNQRFTFGQRMDGLTLDLLEAVVEARYGVPLERAAALKRFNLILEKLRVLWRHTAGRGWISQGQLLHAATRVDEMGRMAGAWLRSTEKNLP